MNTEQTLKLIAKQWCKCYISSKIFRTYKNRGTLNTYSHMFSTALDNVVSIIDNLE